jgi:hypothetical protein
MRVRSKPEQTGHPQNRAFGWSELPNMMGLDVNIKTECVIGMKYDSAAPITRSNQSKSHVGVLNLAAGGIQIFCDVSISDRTAKGNFSFIPQSLNFPTFSEHCCWPMAMKVEMIIRVG